MVEGLWGEVWEFRRFGGCWLVKCSGTLFQAYKTAALALQALRGQGTRAYSIDSTRSCRVYSSVL